MTYTPMIDVSANNHLAGEPVQWTLVYAASYRAVMVKCTEGVDYVNPWLGEDAAAAHKAGLKVGYYHFAHPGENVATDEAHHACDIIAALPCDLGLALDLELTEGCTWVELAAWAREFHREARKQVEHSPLYTPPSLLENLVGAPWGWRLWLPQTARPRREVWAWQMTSPTVVPGISVPTDVGWLHPDA